MTHRLPQSVHLAIRLQREWNRLSRRPDVLSVVNAWPIGGESIVSLDDLLRRAGYGWAGDGASDAVLCQLVRLAHTDDLAARVVLQRILPGLASVANRRGGNHPTRTATAFDEIVGCAWQVIRTYPVERRPRWIAANLVRDSNYQAFTRPARTRQHPMRPFDSSPTGDELAAPPSDPEPLFELVDFLRDATAAGGDADDVQLVARLASAASVADVAAELRVTDRTIRTRRAAAIERLRQVAA